MTDISKINDFLNQYDEAKHEKMFRVYLDNLEHKLEECIQGHQHMDVSQIRFATHDLKSMLFTLKIDKVGEKARIVEEALVNNDTETAFENIEELIEQVRQLITVMKSHPLHQS